MRIKVTNACIENGTRRDSSECPIALAIEDSQDIIEADVSEDDVVIMDIYNERQYDLPDEAIKFIIAFDSGLPVEPFEFDLENGYKPTR